MKISRISPPLQLLFFALSVSFCNKVKGQQEEAPPLRIAIAGLNHDHAAFFFGRKKDSEIQLVGIYEPDTVLVRRYAEKYHIPASLFFDSLGKMLDAVRPEAVVAFCSTDKHLSVVRACAPRHIHVMVEKPLATQVGAARLMERLVDKYHILLLTDYETAWYPSTEKAYQLVEDSAYIGKITKVIFHDGHQGPAAIHVSREFLSWLTDPVKTEAVSSWISDAMEPT